MFTNRKKVLIADDDVELLQLLKEIVRIHGYDAYLARSVGEARRSLERNKFDLALFESEIGGKDSLKLLAEVSEGGKKLNTVIISGNIGKVVEEKAKMLGVRSLISKPFTFQQIGEILHQLDYSDDMRMAEN